VAQGVGPEFKPQYCAKKKKKKERKKVHSLINNFKQKKEINSEKSCARSSSCPGSFQLYKRATRG
jgi:hypothetical protein